MLHCKAILPNITRLGPSLLLHPVVSSVLSIALPTLFKRKSLSVGSYTNQFPEARLVS